MSRYVKELQESKEVVYGCDDYGYFYLLFDDLKGVPEEDFLIEKEDSVPSDEFVDFLEKIKANPEHILSAKQNKYF